MVVHIPHPTLISKRGYVMYKLLKYNLFSENIRTVRRLSRINPVFRRNRAYDVEPKMLG